MFIKKLEYFFLGTMLISLLILAKNWYDDYIFDNSPLSQQYLQIINEKEKEVLALMYSNYGFTYEFPLIITDKIKGRLYGVTSYENNGDIKIYLNKRVMKESMEYMIDNVIAHEYAHALLFKLNNYTHEDGGHSKTWQETCIKLGGHNCQRYVNHNDVVMGKMPF